MEKRKAGTLFAIFLLFILKFAFASVSVENIKSFDAMYELQKDPDQLKYALDCTLSTLMYAEENFPSQISAEILLERIYSKLGLIEKYSVEDEIIISIIKESTNDLLRALKTVDEETDKYQQAYPLMDFVAKDFSQTIEQFHFEKFKEYFELNKLNEYQLIESLDGKQLQKLTAKIIETIIQNNYSLTNETYSKMVNLGKDKLLNYLNIQINPYLNKNQVETYEKQFYLLKAYSSLYKYFHGQSYEENIPKDKYNYYKDLSDYYDYLSNVEILSRRLLTAEKETLSNLFPVFLDYIEQYEDINLKTDKLNKTLQSMIKNASTRFSYEKSELRVENMDLSEISVSNEGINTSLKNLITLINSKKQNEVITEKKSILSFISKTSLFLYLLIITGILLLILIVLPLKFKASLLKNFGLNNRALSLFEKAAIKNPMDPDVHIKTAQIYEKLGREEEAMNEYKIASKVLDMKED